MRRRENITFRGKYYLSCFFSPRRGADAWIWDGRQQQALPFVGFCAASEAMLMFLRLFEQLFEEAFPDNLHGREEDGEDGSNHVREM